MIRRIGRILGRLFALAVLLVLVLLAPILWVETICRGTTRATAYALLLSPEHRRAESRTLMTYPEWHIVHAYDDYARVIATGDPHDFGFLRAIAGFWTSLCALSQAAGHHGGVTDDSKATIYTIGVSFTVELAMKALYEKTVGRAATWVRGDSRAPLDDLSAAQAAAYARFLQQVPWYEWDFRADAAALRAQAGDGMRDRERAVALGFEYRAKARYAALIDAAVGRVGADAASLRSVVAGLDTAALRAFPEVEVIATRPEGIEIETPRYRAFTHLARDLAEAGANFVEIAGNDDILLTVTAPDPFPGALHGFARQGYGDTRSLLVVKVADLAEVLRALAAGPATLEHIHDY